MRREIKVIRYVDLFDCFKDFWASKNGDSLDNSYWKYIHDGTIPFTTLESGIGWDVIKSSIRRWVDSGEVLRFVWGEKIGDDRFLYVWFDSKCPPIEVLKLMESELECLYVPRFKNRSKDEYERKKKLKDFYIKLTMECYYKILNRYYY